MHEEGPSHQQLPEQMACIVFSYVLVAAADAAAVDVAALWLR